MQRSASKSTPSTPNGPPAKKARLSNGTSAPGTPTTPSEYGTPQPATTADDKRREAALARAAEQSGETRWVLSFKDPQHGQREPVMQVRQAGFAAIDAEEDSDDEEEQRPARMQFGGGLKKKKKAVRQRGRSGANILTMHRHGHLRSNRKRRSRRVTLVTWTKTTPLPNSSARPSVKSRQRSAMLVVSASTSMTRLGGRRSP